MNEPPVDVSSLIARGEDETIEFKRSLAERDDALHTLAAFSSQRGGVVVFGVAPNGRVVGVDIGPNTLENLVQAITSAIDPRIFPSIDYQPVDNKMVITVKTIADGRVHTCGGRYYVRVGRVTTLGTQDEYLRQLAARQPAAAAETPADAARRLLRRAVEDDLKTSTLALGALTIADQFGLPDRHWLRQEVVGYPRATQRQAEGVPPEISEEYPRYRQLTAHGSNVLPSRLGLLSAEEWIQRRPDIFVQQVLLHPEGLAEIEQHLEQDARGMFIVWIGPDYGPASGEHDAAGAIYVRAHAFHGLLAQARQRIIDFLLSLTSGSAPSDDATAPTLT